MLGRRGPSALQAAIGIAVVLLASSRVSASDWPPLPPGLLADSVSHVESHAPAEAALWDVRIEHGLSGDQIVSTERHLLRIKVLTIAGVESQSRFDIPHFRDQTVSEIDARVIEPDGRIVRLDRRTVSERVLARENREELRVTSFVVPDVRVGCVIDASWTIGRRSDFGYVTDWLQLQRDIPVRDVVCHVRPATYQGSGVTLRSAVYHTTMPSPQGAPDGTYGLDFGSMRAARDEAWAPPDEAVRAALLLYYDDEDNTKDNAVADRYWSDLRRRITREFEPRIGSPGRWAGEIPAMVGDATTREDRLARIYGWCQKEIRNLDDPARPVPPAEREKLARNRTVRDTWDHGAGDAGDITLLFVALLRAAGFDARVALGARTDVAPFRYADSNPVALKEFLALVRMDDGWRFYDPGAPAMPCGLVPWNCEGQSALVAGEDSIAFLVIPPAPAQRSRVMRRGTFTLGADGTLEGDVRIERTGHEAVIARWPWIGKDATEWAKGIGDWAAERFPGATVTDARMSGVEDPTQPLVWSFHLSAPHYAEVTGKRLLVRPLVFASSEAPMFGESTRRLPVDLHFHRCAFDEVSIALPPGYAVEQTTDPQPWRLADFGSLDIHLQADASTRVLRSQRAYVMERTSFVREDYARLKGAFDELHADDGVTVVLTATAAAAR